MAILLDSNHVPTNVNWILKYSAGRTSELKGALSSTGPYQTLFISCHELLLHLRAAYEKGSIERVIKRYDVLIIYEIGYLPIQKVEVDLFFQLLTLR